MSWNTCARSAAGVLYTALSDRALTWALVEMQRDMDQLSTTRWGRMRQQADSNTVFVFGSNLAGRHGAGAAKEARYHWGAVYGMPKGRQGMSYAIPTKDRNLVPLPLDVIRGYVLEFLEYARRHSELTFLVTAVGTGLAGYQHVDIGPMFRGAPSNCQLPAEWSRFVGAISKI